MEGSTHVVSVVRVYAIEVSYAHNTAIGFNVADFELSQTHPIIQ